MKRKLISLLLGVLVLISICYMPEPIVANAKRLLEAMLVMHLCLEVVKN